jgi:hypothetical protein
MKGRKEGKKERRKERKKERRKERKDLRRDLRNYHKRPHICVKGVPEGDEKEGRAERVFKKKLMGASRVAQVVECLPSKCEALSSNPTVTRKKN